MQAGGRTQLSNARSMVAKHRGWQCVQRLYINVSKACCIVDNHRRAWEVRPRAEYQCPVRVITLSATPHATTPNPQGPTYTGRTVLN
eukprot:1155453-Pelagomonas_calceolata.AAC.2